MTGEETFMDLFISFGDYYPTLLGCPHLEVVSRAFNNTSVLCTWFSLGSTESTRLGARPSNRRCIQRRLSFRFFSVFSYQAILANLDVALRVIRPSLGLSDRDGRRCVIAVCGQSRRSGNTKKKWEAQQKSDAWLKKRRKRIQCESQIGTIPSTNRFKARQKTWFDPSFFMWINERTWTDYGKIGHSMYFASIFHRNNFKVEWKYLQPSNESHLVFSS